MHPRLVAIGLKLDPLKVFLAGVAFFVIIAAVSIIYNKLNREEVFTPAMKEHIQNIRSDLSTGRLLEGAIVEFRGESFGLVYDAKPDEEFIVLFPTKRGGMPMYLWINWGKDDSLAFHIARVIRSSDSDYPAAREKLLPALKKSSHTR